MSGSTSSLSVSEQLGVFVAGRAGDPGGAAPAPRRQAERALVNFFAAALAVSRDPDMQPVLDIVRQFSGPPQATLIGHGERIDALGAAFFNAIAGNLLDYDDTHLPTVIHPTAPVAPAALALAEWRGLGGAALLDAFAIGAEIECRLGNAVSPGHYDRGWHITATCGVFGAAAACSRLLALDSTRTAHAIGIAASLACGVVENLPSGAKNAGVGSAARNGLLAALLAERGTTAAAGAIEGRLGWARASGDEPDLAAILDGLGEHWEFERNSYKPYPCGIVMHAVIDACLELHDQGLAVADIDSIEVSGDALLLARGDRPVRNDRDARVSIHHCAAVALLRGDAGVAAFSPQQVADEATVALRARIRARLDADLPRGAARVRVRCRDGRALEATVLHARGSAERPLGDDELAAKLQALAAAAPGVRGDAVIEQVEALSGAADLSALMAALAGR